MRVSIDAVKARIKSFARENPVMLGVFFFLLFSGIASGIHSMSAFSGSAAHMVKGVPAMLHTFGANWFYLAAMSLCLHGLIASMLLLSGLLLPAGVLWPVSILLRGFFTGCVLGLIVNSWPHPSTILLLLVYILNAALLIPVLLQLCAVAKSQMFIHAKRILGLSHKTQSVTDCAAYFLRACLGLIPCVAVESLVAPLVLYIFG